MTTTATQIAAIRNALTLLPTKQQKMPEPLAGVLAVHDRLRAELPMKVDQYTLATRLAEHRDPATLDHLLAELEGQVIRGQLGQLAWAGNLTGALDRAAAAALTTALPNLVKKLQDVFDDAVRTLTQAAPELPEGAAALDPAAILNSDAESAFRRTRDALAVIAAVAPIYGTPYQTDGSTPLGSEVVTVAAVPACGPLKWNGIHDVGGELNTDEDLARLHGVQALVKDYRTNPDLAVIGIARHAYPDVALSLAADPQEVATRIGRVATAHRRQRVTDTDTRPGSKVQPNPWQQVPA